MDPCYIVFAAFCFSPTDLVDINIFRDRGHALVSEYETYDLSLIDSHHKITLNQELSSKICVEDSCVYYHQYCETNDQSQTCRYTIQRQSYCEDITLTFRSKTNEYNEGWRNDVSLYLDKDQKHSVSLGELSVVDATKELPRYESRAQLMGAITGCSE